MVRIRKFDGSVGVSEDWHGLLGSGRQVFCLNFGGDLVVMGGASRLYLRAGMVGAFLVTQDLRANTMHTGQRAFDFMTVEADLDWIAREFAAGLAGDFPGNSAFRAGGPGAISSPARIASVGERAFFADVISPPVEGVARTYWYKAKVLEFLSLRIFQEERTPFCTSHRVRTTERVADALSRLRERMDEPFDLARLAREVKVSPATLSRLVSGETGLTLSRHLRAMRIERAVELMRDGGANVTEAAMEVGYSSLSHFSKAFHAEKGMLPSVFSAGKGD
jgi:AraC-like DNA-binding protein